MRQLFFLLFICNAFIAVGQTLPEDVAASAKKRVEYGINQSIVIGIVDKKGERYYTFGTKMENGGPVDKHSIYEIGSISKTFTSILLAQKVLTGKMKLDDPIKKYLPGSVKVPTYQGHEITLGNLADHTSGLPRMPSNFKPADPTNPFADYTTAQLYEFLSSYTLTRDVGSEYEYSNLAQGLLGHILALQSGTTYEALMIKAIASPLGMKETKVSFDANMKEHLAMGYSNGKQVSNWDIPMLAGAGGIRSSANDMLKYISANAGLTKTSIRKAMDLTHTVRHDKAGGERVGLAWHLSTSKAGDLVWHNGGTGGYRTFAGFIKEKGMGVVVLTNSSANIDDLCFHLLDPEKPLIEIKKPITPVLKNIIDAQGVENAIVRYRALKKDSATVYDLSESSINQLGYHYLATNLDAAIAIFKLNKEEYPNSSNVYDSYGEALLKAATENYSKSVELNPNNTQGIEVLKKLGVTKDANIEVSESVLEKYVGKYALAPTFILDVTREGKHLFAQATGQPKFEIYPKSETEFYLKVVDAQITFDIENEMLTLHQNGQHMPAKLVK